MGDTSIYGRAEEGGDLVSAAAAAAQAAVAAMGAKGFGRADQVGRLGTAKTKMSMIIDQSD